MLRLLLGHHPKLTACEEFEFVAPFLKRAPEAWPCVHRYRAALPSRLNVRLGKLLPLPHHATFPELANALLWRLARADGKRQVGAVVHHDFEHLPRLWPNARFIYLVRDPRDVTRSCVKMGWFGNPHGAVGMWRAAQRRFGYLLWLGRVGANRLPWPALQRFVQRRWDAIVERHLK